MKFADQRPLRFILFGDSLTQRSFTDGGWGSKLYNKYPRHADVINRGFSGYNTRWCNDIKQTVCNELRSDVLNIITIWLGANDAVHLSSGRRQFVGIQEYKSTLRSIVDHIYNFAVSKKFKCKIIIFTPPPLSEKMVIKNQVEVYKEDAIGISQRSLENTRLYANAVNDLYVNHYSDNSNILLLELFEALMKVPDWENVLFEDGLHFSQIGNHHVYELLQAFLEKEISILSDFDSILYQYPWHHEIQMNGKSLVEADISSFYSHHIIILKNAYVWDWEQIRFIVSSVIVDKDTNKFIDTNLFYKFQDKFTNVETKDYQDKIILPGLVDAHMHIELLGTALSNLALNGVSSLKELQEKLGEYIKRDDKVNTKDTISGFGWDHEKFLQDNKALPTKALLDEVCPNRPVLVNRVCIHIGCANSKALEIANALELSKKGVPGGEFDVDENGELTGIVREKALGVVMRALEAYDKTVIDMDVVREKYILKGLHYSLSHGLTTVNTNDKFSFHIYKKLDEQNKLPIRVNLVTDNSEVHDRPPFHSDSKMFKNTRLKFFSDGSLGSSTAAIKSKDGKEFKGFHETQKNYKGLLLYSDDSFREGFTKATNAGYQLEVHCIGDASAEQVVLAMKDVLGDSSREKRPQITHCQILTPDLITQMASMGIVGNLQPSFVPTDVSFLPLRIDNDESYFGYDRLKYSYCWNSLIKAGMPVTGSSDAPVEPVNPLKGMFDAMVRPRKHCFEDKSLKISEIEPFSASEKLHFSQALNLYSASAHFGSFDESTRGRIEHDFYADMTILSLSDLMLLKNKKYEEVLRSSEIFEVWINGNERLQVHRASLPQKRKLDGVSCC